jgi:hypothetical protein
VPGDPIVRVFGRTVPACDQSAPEFGQTVLACDQIAPAFGQIAPALDRSVPAPDQSAPAPDRSARPLAPKLGRHVPNSAPRPAIGSAQAARSARKVLDHSGSKRVVLNSVCNHTKRAVDHRALDPNNRARAPNRLRDRKGGGEASKGKLGTDNPASTIFDQLPNGV